MRFTTTAGRAAAVALAAATLGLGATASAQAVTIGGGTTITNGGCSVLVEVMNGSVVVEGSAHNGGCSFSIFDSTSGRWLVEGPAPLAGAWVYTGPFGKLTGCLSSTLTGTRVCDPLN
ncbi:hypothetical protein ABH930_004728 [Kitasatospora sp. GAS204A]|nr:hypothetical protein [Kitasatospora sp. GAS204B]